MNKEMNIYSQIGVLRQLKKLKLISQETEDLITNNIINRLPLIYNITSDSLFLLNGLKAVDRVDEVNHNIFYVELVLEDLNKELHSEIEMFVIGEPFKHEDLLQVIEIYKSVINTLCKVN